MVLSVLADAAELRAYGEFFSNFILVLATWTRRAVASGAGVDGAGLAAAWYGGNAGIGSVGMEHACFGSKGEDPAAVAERNVEGGGTAEHVVHVGNFANVPGREVTIKYLGIGEHCVVCQKTERSDSCYGVGEKRRKQKK